MSLSEICVQQHEHEQKKLKRLLLWGLVGSLGAHGIALSLSQFNVWQAATDEVSPIELIVTDSPTEPLPDDLEVLPDPAQPAELSTQTNDPAAATASAPPRAAVVAPPAPVAPPVEPIAPDSPEPLENTQAESALEEPQPNVEEEAPTSEAEAAEVAEDLPDDVEEDVEPEAVATEPTESQFERLRNLQQQLRESRADRGTSTTAAPTESATAGAGTVPNAPAGDRPGVAAAPSTTNGSGQGQGSRTVACQNCVRPSYPRSALDAGAEGQPMVSVDINPDGSVRSVTLTRSSGNAEIDQAAIQAARNSRFQPVTGGASVPIEYDLTIEGSRRNRDARRRGERQTVDVPPEPTPATETADTPPAADTFPNPDPSEDGAEDAPATPSAASDASEIEPSETEASGSEPSETESSESEPSETESSESEPEPATATESAPTPPIAPSQNDPVPAPEPTPSPVNQTPTPAAPPPSAPPATVSPPIPAAPRPTPAAPPPAPLAPRPIPAAPRPTPAAPPPAPLDLLPTPPAPAAPPSTESGE
ncbi:MAG: TonB family protein [Kaiparowitsia implicata GSE-PSE-MK54-09C]|nr:TonB family protein [Kaiparowitsia implicata GSE-PSE-MK54-09C]